MSATKTINVSHEPRIQDIANVVCWILVVTRVGSLLSEGDSNFVVAGARFDLYIELDKLKHLGKIFPTGVVGRI